MLPLLAFGCLTNTIQSLKAFPVIPLATCVVMKCMINSSNAFGMCWIQMILGWSFQILEWWEMHTLLKTILLDWTFWLRGCHHVLTHPGPKHPSNEEMSSADCFSSLVNPKGSLQDHMINCLCQVLANCLYWAFVLSLYRSCDSGYVGDICNKRELWNTCSSSCQLTHLSALFQNYLTLHRYV